MSAPSLPSFVTVIEVSTTVDVPPAEAYAFVLDFEGHADYSEFVRDVVRRGDGSVGTRFDIELSWWKLSYTFPTQVTAIDEPSRIGWRTPNGLHARGEWAFDPVESGTDGGATTTDDTAGGDAVASSTRVTLRAEYDRSRSRLPRLPPLVSVDDVLSRLKPVVRREATKVFEHAIADLEGERRRVTLDVDVY
nr:SRPBCC family protein [Halorubellus salinus]